MFHLRTVFILGAGASHEVGFPLGKALTAKISELVDFKFEHGQNLISGDAELYSTIKRRFGSEANEYRRAGAFIASGIQLADSIDDFLSLHQSDKRITFVGKLGIARAILAEEKKCKMSPRGLPGRETVNFKEIGDTWYVKLFKILSREVPKEAIDQIFNNVAFVNFNYDRSLEFFLWHAIQRLYGVDASRSAEIVSRLRVFRPYGSVGPLAINRGGPGIEFASEEIDHVEAANRIKTYSEKVDESDDLRKMRDEVAAAKLIVFLGLHFHEQNLKLISSTKRAGAENIFATAYGFSDEDRSVVEGQLDTFLAGKYRDGAFLSGEGPVRLQNLTCAELFDRYSKTLPHPAAIEPTNFHAYVNG